MGSRTFCCNALSTSGFIWDTTFLYNNYLILTMLKYWVLSTGENKKKPAMYGQICIGFYHIFFLVNFFIRRWKTNTVENLKSWYLQLVFNKILAIWHTVQMFVPWSHGFKIYLCFFFNYSLLQIFLLWSQRQHCFTSVIESSKMIEIMSIKWWEHFSLYEKTLIALCSIKSILNMNPKTAKSVRY